MPPSHRASDLCSSVRVPYGETEGPRILPGETDWAYSLAGGGKMGARIRTFDWSSTPLGPLAEWATSLRQAVSLAGATGRGAGRRLRVVSPAVTSARGTAVGRPRPQLMLPFGTLAHARLAPRAPLLGPAREPGDRLQITLRPTRPCVLDSWRSGRELCCPRQKSRDYLYVCASAGHSLVAARSDPDWSCAGGGEWRSDSCLRLAIITARTDRPAAHELAGDGQSLVAGDFDLVRGSADVFWQNEVKESIAWMHCRTP
jgi:hypothetical protein